MREAQVEKRLCDRVKAAFGAAYKFTSPARRSVPDRLVLMPVPRELQAVVAKYVRFVECKAPGQKATDQQAREHERLRDLGYRVDVVDSYEAVEEWL